MKEVVIDLKAANKTDDKSAAQSDFGLGRPAESRSSEQDRFRGFADPYAGSGLGGARAYYYAPEAAMPYEDTFIGVHHNARGVRFAFQANNRKALIILVVVIALLSHPGFFDLMLSVLKPMLGVH
jgi:hypothetical protein